jgi:hypothetical protein
MMSIGELIFVLVVAGVVAWLVGGVHASRQPTVVYVQVERPTLGRGFGCVMWAVIGLVVVLVLGMLQR